VRLENGREILGCVIVCTGGFGASRELLRDHAPSVAEYPTTNGAFATGDGLRMLVKVGAQLRGLEHVQLHPTGIIDPSDREAKTKFLAPEAFRGFGGLLLNADGDRFVDELANRQVVADAMRRQDGQRAFLLVPLDAANHIGRSQMEFYNTRGLCRYARNRSDLPVCITKNVFVNGD